MRVEDLAPGLNLFFEGLAPRQNPIKGWSRLSWGMSQAQVAYNFPQAQTKADDASQMLLKPAAPQNLEYSLAFQFSGPGRQLSSLTLTFGGSRGVADFAALSQAISARLGAPVSQTQTSSTWSQEGGQLTLSQSPLGGLVLSQSA